jgi:hypothetical protein
MLQCGWFLGQITGRRHVYIRALGIYSLNWVQRSSCFGWMLPKCPLICLASRFRSPFSCTDCDQVGRRGTLHRNQFARIKQLIQTRLRCSSAQNHRILWNWQTDPRKLRTIYIGFSSNCWAMVHDIVYRVFVSSHWGNNRHSRTVQGKSKDLGKAGRDTKVK